MGKREVKPVVPVTPKTEPTTEKNTDIEESVENKDTTATDEPVKEEEGVVSETTEKEIKTEDATEEEVDEEKKNETDDVKKEEDSNNQEEEPAADSKLTETVVPEAKPQMIEAEEYFVKYRNFSYLHCEWRTEEEMYKGDKRIQAKLKRFKQKQQQNTNIFENVLEAYYLKTCLYNICN